MHCIIQDTAIVLQWQYVKPHIKKRRIRVDTPRILQKASDYCLITRCTDDEFGVDTLIRYIPLLSPVRLTGVVILPV